MSRGCRPSATGDLDAAREFHTSVTRSGRGGSRNGRGGGGGSYRGAHGGNGAAPGNYASAAHGNGNVSMLATAPPAHYWAPTHILNNAANQAAIAKERAIAASNAQSTISDNGGSRPMDIDGRTETAAPSLTPSIWGAAGQPVQPRAGSHAVPIVAPQPSDLATPTDGGAPSPPRGLAASTHAATASAQPQNANRADVTYGPHGTPVGRIEPFTRPLRSSAAGEQFKQAQKGTIAAPATPTGGAEHLDANGQLKGTGWRVDQGPVHDSDWIVTHNCEKLALHCRAAAEAASEACNPEARKALDHVVKACEEVLHAKNVLNSHKLYSVAMKALSTAQKDAWEHWCRFYQSAPHTADPVAAASKASVDAPAISGQPQYAQTPEHPQVVQGPGFGGTVQSCDDLLTLQHQPLPNEPKLNSGIDFGANSARHLTNLAAHQPAQQQPVRDAQTQQAPQTQPAQHQPVRDAKIQRATQTQPSQPSKDMVDMPRLFPRGLPKDFDDPQARLVFEEYFFQNKGLP